MAHPRPQRADREKRPSLLFHRGTAWSGAVRGSTNILAQHFLDAGYPVAWLSRPFHAGHLARGPSELHSTDRWDDGVLEIAPFTALPILKLPAFGSWAWKASAQLGYRTILPSLQQTFRHHRQPPPDLIWTTGGDGGALRAAFPDAACIVQCVDIYEGYAGSVQNALEEADYRAADAVVTIGRSLADYLVCERNVDPNKLNVIGQGADMDLFAEALPEPADLMALPRPRLIWVGVLEKADAELMAAAEAALPDGAGTLVLIGPSASWAEALAARSSRVRLFGPRPARTAAAYLQHADVGLMLYDRTRNPLIYQGQHPLKLYEMAAARLPIVSSPHAEYAFLDHPALLAADPAGVRTAIADALARHQVLAQASWDFACRHSWRRRFEEAEALVLATLAARAQSRRRHVA